MLDCARGKNCQEQCDIANVNQVLLVDTIIQKQEKEGSISHLQSARASRPYALLDVMMHNTKQ